MAKPHKHRGKWRIRWTDEVGRRRSESFATFSMAAKAQRRRECESEERKHGLREPELEEHGFDELMSYQLTFKTPNKRSPKDDTSILSRHLGPFLGKTPLTAIGVSHVARYVELKRRQKISPKTINNHLTLLGTMLRLAVDLGWAKTTPRIDKIKCGETAFQYLRSRKDIDALLDAARVEAGGTRELYAAAVFTGMRAGELFGLKWVDVDFDRRLITVQRSFDKPTKSAKVRHVPILDALLPILRAWRLRNPLPLVFPNQHGKMHTPSPRVSQEILHGCLKCGGLERIRFHDLRHTFASHWMTAGGDIYRLQRILGHSTIVMTERYAHLSPDVYVDDYARLGAAPMDETARVLTLTRAK